MSDNEKEPYQSTQNKTNGCRYFQEDEALHGAYVLKIYRYFISFPKCTKKKQLEWIKCRTITIANDSL